MEERTLDISFPSLPSTVTEVQSFIGSGKTNPEPLVEIIERDPSVSVNVLRRANSAYYGLRREVESVDHAVRLLGFIEICAITMIEGMDKMRQRFSQHPAIFRSVLREAVFTGRFAQKMTAALDLPLEWRRPSFLAGSIYVMGRLVLLYAAPTRYEELVAQFEAPLPTTDAERCAFGVSHRSLAPLASDRWGLPDRICSVLRVAEEPAPAPQGPRRTLALSLRSGSHFARQDMTEEPFTLPETLKEVGGEAIEARAAEVAEDVSSYVTESVRL